MSPPGLTSAGANGHRGPVQQAAAHHAADSPGINGSPPAPRVTLPVALRPLEASSQGAIDHGSTAIGNSLGRPATGQQRDDAAALGSVGVGEGGREHGSGQERRDAQAGTAAQALDSPPAGIFGIAEHPVPRMFTRPVAASGDAEPSNSDATASSGREQADDAASDGDYSPTSDPRLGPFARPPADRAASTPDRCPTGPSSTWRQALLSPPTLCCTSVKHSGARGRSQAGSVCSLPATQLFTCIASQET